LAPHDHILTIHSCGKGNSPRACEFPSYTVQNWTTTLFGFPRLPIKAVFFPTFQTTSSKFAEDFSSQKPQLFTARNEGSYPHATTPTRS
jgi:hypothetical protein